MLFITDSSNKIPAIRTAFPHDTVLAVDFPLFGRFTRSSKLKYDVWPKLKPLAKSKIDKLVKVACTHREIFTVLDPTPFGRTQARDIQEALRGVNARVSFLFPKAITSEAVKNARHENIEEPDTRYVVDRYVAQKMNSALEAVFNASAEVELNRAQAYVLGTLFNVSETYKPFFYDDPIGRRWFANEPKTGELVQRQVMKRVSPKPWPLVSAPVAWDRLWSGLERLQTSGLVTACETKMPESTFDVCCQELDRLGIKPKSDTPDIEYFWCINPLHDASLIVDELAARPLFQWLKVETLRACCDDFDAVFLQGKSGAFTYSAPINASWFPLDQNLITASPYSLDAPNSISLNLDLVRLCEVARACRNVLNEREVWSSFSSLLRRGYVKRSTQGLYLSSRGCSAVLALQQTMPCALTDELSRIVDSIVGLDSEESRLDSLNALFSEYVIPADINMWDQFLNGRPLRMCMTRASSWIASMDDEHQFGIAMVDGRIRPVKPGIKLRLPCTCGSNAVKTMLDASFEPVFTCDCGKQFALTTLKQMEQQ